jgi:hypothetical protein
LDTSQGATFKPSRPQAGGLEQGRVSAKIVGVQTWRALLLIYPALDVRLRGGGLRRRRFQHNTTERELADATESFRAFPDLVSRLTDGTVQIREEVVSCSRALMSLAPLSGGSWWASPDDARSELEQIAPPGTYDSVFVFWPQHDFVNDTHVPGGAWGLAVGASEWTNGATYAAVANARTHAWQGEAPGEVWLHEWLHGVCAHFAARGHQMPFRDADGADTHGYVRSPIDGWTAYYRDLMTGNVLEDGQRVGIPVAAWLAPRDVMAA